MTPAPKSSIAPSISAAARMTGLERKTMQRWKVDGCKAFLADGTVDMILLAERAAESTGGRPMGDDLNFGNEDSPTKQVRLKILQEQLKDWKRENAKEDGLLMAKSDVDYVITKGTNALFAELDRIANTELPSVLFGLDKPGILAALTAANARIKSNFRAALGALASEADKTEETK